MNNIMRALQMIQTDPVQFLAQRRINIPQNISNDPNAIIQHLLNTGQISQQQYNNANNMARQFMPRQ